MSNHNKKPTKGQFLIYQTEDGKIKLNVHFENESVWLTQQLMADLFQTTKQNINFHVQNIYEEDELLPKSTVKEYLTVRLEDNRKIKRQLKYYNLDMIFPGLWEWLNNPDFRGVEFDSFFHEAGSNAFTL